MRLSTRRRFGYVLVGFALLAIAIATLTPTPSLAARARETPVWCLVCGELGGVDVLLNLLLFAPLGLGLRLAGFRLLPAVILAATITFNIELLQMKVIPGRDASLSDVLTNTTGATVAYFLTATWRHWLLARPRRSFRLGLLAAGAWLAVLVGTAALLQPSLPEGRYWGQWAPRLAHLADFEGRVLSADAAGIPLPPGPLFHSAEVRAALLSDSAAVGARIVTGPSTRRLASIVSIADEAPREIVLLGQDGTDLVIRRRSWAVAARLRPPALRLADALPVAGDTVEVRGGADATGLWLEASHAGQVVRTRAGYSSGWGWVMLLPMSYAIGPEALWLNALWLATLLFPAGWFFGRAPGAAGPLLLATALALGLAALPVVAALPPPPLSEWLAAAAGGLLGWLAGRITLSS